MRKKILFFLDSLTSGGAERITFNIINQLDADKYDITLVLVRKEGEFYNQIPQNISEIIELQATRTLYSLFELRKIVKRIKPDYLYSTLYFTSIALAFSLFGIKGKSKLILRNPTSPKVALENGDLSGKEKRLIGFAFKMADLVLAQTPDMKEEIIKYHHVDAGKVEVYINPVDIDTIEKSIAGQTNPYNEKKINIISAGRLSYEKGFDVLVEAFSKVHKENSNFHLNIIGEDKGEQSKLENMIGKFGLEQHVTLWGFQENPYIFYAYSDMYVLPSRREGLPNVVLEYQYFKKPVIATKCVPFMHELIDNGVNGYLVDVNDVEEMAAKIISYESASLSQFYASKQDTFEMLIERLRG